MEEHIACKEVVKPRFGLSTEVTVTLERKFDRWAPLRAYNRVSKELTLLTSLCKMPLCFLKKNPEDAEDKDVLCDGRVVRMFSDMIRKSFKDEEFMSGRPVFLYFFTFMVLLRVGCFLKGNLFLSPLFVGALVDLDLIDTEELWKIVCGEVKPGKEEDQMSVKVCLELINLLTNISAVRKDATNSALRYLFLNSKDNDYNNNSPLKRKSTFDQVKDDQSEGGKLCKISTCVTNRGVSKVDQTIVVETDVQSSYALDDFTISDTGVISFDRDVIYV